MNRFFQTFANAADGVLIINQDQHIIYWNQAAEEILGYTPQEVTARPCYEVLDGRDEHGRLVCHKYCRLAMAGRNGGTLTNYDSTVHTKMGDIRWINVSTFTLPLNGSDSSRVLVHLFRDVTRRKQNEQFIDQVLNAARQLRNGELSRTVPSTAEDIEATDLTDREREVLSLLAEGHSTEDMARSLSISPATVRNHVRNIFQKLQVHSRLEAVIYAQEHGLVPKD